MASINYFSQSVRFKLPFPRKTSAWIKSAITKEKQSLKQLNFIFCSDEELYQLNVEYLNHKTLTDIITFDNSEQEGLIEGDIYISLDRIKENSVTFGKSFENELKRVIIHGVLHLLGYTDKTNSSQKKMRAKEDFYLSRF